MHDWLIKGALLFDGKGSAPMEADLAMAGGVISGIGKDLGAARQTMDARGLFLAPGLIDLHTHYDAQALWDPSLSPSCSLGVTTVVAGNCGFGIAPNRPKHRDLLLKNLSVVEGMDLEALRAGVQWSFESFEEYLVALRKAKPWLNMAVFAQHSTIRTAVMGEDASHRAPSTQELEQMRHEVARALRAGAIGLASSFSPNHSGWQGAPMPSTVADHQELQSLIEVLGQEQRGVFMMATGPRVTPEELASFHTLTGARMFLSTVLTMYNDDKPELGLSYYERVAALQDQGREVYIQTSCQPLSFEFNLLDPYLLYSHPSFAGIKSADEAGKRSHYESEAFRKAFKQDLKNPAVGVLFSGRWDRIFVGHASHPKVQRFESQSIAAIAACCGQDPVDCFFDLALMDGLQTEFLAQLFNANDDGVQPLISHRAGLITLSDAGAHLKFMCDAGYGLHFLGHWVRDRQAMSWSQGIARLTSEPAQRYRIAKRGRLELGCWADLMLFDPIQVGISPVQRASDLPAAPGHKPASRLIRRPQGLAGVWVNGTRVFDGQQSIDGLVGPGQVLDQFHWDMQP
ncbi:MAG: N-acyl-D-amino-acid deacylase family protein [Betaproteobacteria bacterium]